MPRRIHERLDAKSVFNSQTNSRTIECQVRFRFTDDLVPSQSSIDGRIHDQIHGRLGTESVFNSRTNARPIGWQVSLRFTENSRPKIVFKSLANSRTNPRPIGCQVCVQSMDEFAAKMEKVSSKLSEKSHKIQNC